MGNWYEVNADITVNVSEVVFAESPEEAKEKVEKMSGVELTGQVFDYDEIDVYQVLSEDGEEAYYTM